MNRQQHRETVYATKATDAVSWYRPHLDRSLALIERVAPDHRAAALRARSSALLSNSLDYLGDALTYLISLWAVSRSHDCLASIRVLPRSLLKEHRFRQMVCMPRYQPFGTPPNLTIDH